MTPLPLMVSAPLGVVTMPCRVAWPFSVDRMGCGAAGGRIAWEGVVLRGAQLTEGRAAFPSD